MTDDHLKKLHALGGVKEPPQRQKPRSDDAEEVIFLKLDRAVARQFKMLAVELGKSQKQAASEAINLLFAQYGKPQIADDGERK